VAPTASPDEGMPVLVPVGGGAFDGLLDLGPGFEPSPFQRQGAEHLPPRFDQVEVSRILGLEDELPARMEQAEQQNIRRAVSAEVVSDCIDPLDGGIDPGFDLTQEVNPVGCGAAIIGVCKGRAAGRLESAEDITGAIASALVDLLSGPLGLGRRRLDEVLAWKAPGRLRPHLVQADNYAARWRCRVELLDDPLFLAKSGSIRSPNQVSSWRHFRPSRMKISLIRLRRMAMPWSDR
jgi:hypothetical protein